MGGIIIKYISFLLILIILFLSVSAVSASENQTADVLDVQDSKEVVIKDTNPEGTFEDLQNAINSTTGTLELDRNYSYNDDFGSTEGIKFYKDIVIDGKGHTIDGKGKSRIFSIGSYSKSLNRVVLKNINFINANSSRGGAINIDATNASIINSTFINCKSSFAGGAVYWEPHSWGTVTLINSTFRYNSAINKGGALAVNDGKNCLLLNNTFEYNSVKSSSSSYFGEPGGAIHWNDGNGVWMINNTFRHNSASGEGGVYSASGNQYWTYFEGCLFYNNSAKKGGAIMSSPNLVSIKNCSFINNKASEEGGAMGRCGASSINLIYSSYFFNNSAKNGGALELYANITCSNSTFINNSATEYGSTLFLRGPNLGWPITDGVLVNDCYIESSGNAIYSFNLNGTIANSTLINGFVTVDTLSYLTLINNKITTTNNYAVVNNNLVYLDNNRFNKPIYNKGTFNSSVIVTVLFNKTITISQDSYQLTATVTDDNGNNIICDNFKFVDDTNIFQSQYNSDGYYYYDYENIQKGLHIISAADSGLINTTLKKGVLYYTDLPSNYTLVIGDIENYTYGSKNLSISVLLSNLMPGNLTLKLSNGLEKTVVVTSIQTTVVFDDILLPGVYSVEASFSSDEYATKTDTASFEIYKSKDISVSIEDNKAILGEEFVISLSRNVTGNVTVTINNTSFKGVVNQDKARVIIRNIASGNYQVNIKYDGNEIYDESSLTTNLLVLKNNSFTVLSGLLTGNVSLDRDYEYDPATDSPLTIDSKITIEGNNYKIIGSIVYINNETTVNQVKFENNALVIDSDARISKSTFNQYINITSGNVYLFDNEELNKKNYSLYNNGVLFLKNNDFKSVIYNNGQITSHVNITVLDNQTLAIDENSLLIYSSIVDDKGNLIVDLDLNFLIGNRPCQALYNSTNNYAISNDFTRGNNVISIQSANLNNSTIKNAYVNADIYDLYFDASADSDGNGTKQNPYKYLNSRLSNGKTAFFKEGTYALSQSSLNNVHIFGENALNTIIEHNGGISISNTVYINRVTFSGTTFKSGTVNANNSIFKNGRGIVYDRNNHGGIFYNSQGLNIDNCTFSDSRAEYGGVIYSDVRGAVYTISNSIFENNYASRFGGAIAGNGPVRIIIKNTTIINDYSVNDAGGAIYLKDAILSADGLTVINCKSTFGPAVTALSSKVTLVNFTAENNTAKYQGGAIYTIYGSIAIENSTFINNTASSGGGVFIDESDALIINNTKFISNTAELKAGAIYSLLNNVSFIKNIVYVGNKAYNNNDLYETSEVSIVIGNGNYTMHHYRDQVVTVLPTKYDLRDDGFVTPVKDQQAGGNCWAFAAIAALESCLLKASNVTYDLSEGNMKNIMALFSDYGWSTIKPNEGGNDDISGSYLVSWLGPINESDDITDDINHLSPVVNSVVHIQNIIYLKRDSYTDNDAIKEAILKYGAVGTSLYMLGNNQCYRGNDNPNHAVTIVGWDDTYKGCRNYGAEGDGAWICKNSWGNGWDKDGYFYVSYYDTRFAQIGTYASYTFILNDTLKFDKNYQYDIGGKTDYLYHILKSTIWYKNLFTATDDEYLAAVSTYFEKDTDWEVSIIVNGETKLIKTGTSHYGYYTINLDDIVKLNKGDKFEVVFKITVNGDAGIPISEFMSLDKLTYRPGISYFSNDGVKWADLYNYTYNLYPGHNYESQVACIKAFTYLNDVNTQTTLTLSNFTLDSIILTANVLNEFGYVVNTGNITFKINDKNYVVDVKNGVAQLTYNFTSKGSYSINLQFNAIGYNSSSAQTTFEIGDVVAGLEIKNITYGKELIANITFVDEFARLLNTTVTLTISDKSYNISVINGSAVFKIPDTFDANEYDADLIYTNAYLNVDEKIKFSIYKVNSEIIIENVVNGTYNTINPSVSFIVSNRTNVRAVITKNGVVIQNITVNGNATEFINLAAGTYNLTLYNLEDLNIYGSSASRLINVSKASSLVSITNIANATFNTSGAVISLNMINCSDVIYVVSKADVNVTNGKITGNMITLSNLAAGIYDIYILNKDNENYTKSKTFGRFEIYKASSSIAVGSVSNGIYDSLDAVISLNLVNCIDTSYVVTKSDIVVTNGNVGGNTIRLSNLDAGVYDILISNNETENITGFNATASFEILKASSVVEIITTVGGIFNTTNAEVTFTITNKTNAKFTLTKNNVVILNGNITSDTLTFDKLESGNYKLTILNEGNENYNQSSASTLFEVLKANSFIEILTLENGTFETKNPSVNFKVYNKTSVQVIVTKNGIEVYNKVVSDDSISFNDLTPGVYNLTIKNDGNDSFNGYEVSKLFSVDKLEIKTNITVEVYRSTALIKIELSKAVNEKVIVNVSGEIQEIITSNGRYNLTLNNLDFGEYTVLTTLESENYASTGFERFNILVVKTKINANDFVGYYLGNNTYAVSLTTLNGTPVAGKNILFTINNMKFNETTDDDGIAWIPIYFVNGEYFIDLEFEGDSTYINSSANARITVKSTIILPTSSKYTLDSNYIVKILDGNGNPLSKQLISIAFGDIIYDTYTDSNGMISIKINLVPGNYKVTLVNPVNNETASQDISIVKRITDNTNLNMFYLDGSKFKVRVYDDYGNVAKAGQVVKFIISGKTYSAKTDSNGYAYLKINLAPKKYSVTSEYHGFKVSNSIVVKQVINAKKTTKVKRTAKSLKIKVILKGKKPYKKQKLTVKFKGKNYVIKTNNKGIAYFKINKNVIKKLKKGRTYTYVIIYKSSKLKRFVKVI